MSRVVFLGAAMVAMAIGGVAHAQFRLDYAPSAIKPAADPAKDKLDTNRLHPLSPLGGPQGTPQIYQPVTPVAPLQSYAGVPANSGASTLPAGGIGASATHADPSADDPTRPRKPLQPKTIKPGVQPRP